MTYKAEIPYGSYWSTPFARWQGASRNLHSVEFAAHVARRELARREIDPKVFDYGVLGFSVPQKHSFYGLPWLMGLDRRGTGRRPDADAGLRHRRAHAARRGAGDRVRPGEHGAGRSTATAPRNGPHLYYPNPRGPGGTGAAEDWVMDNFGCDPLGRHAMLATAENVAKRHGIGTAEQHEVVLRREAQYRRRSPMTRPSSSAS